MENFALRYCLFSLATDLGQQITYLTVFTINKCTSLPPQSSGVVQCIPLRNRLNTLPVSTGNLMISSAILEQISTSKFFQRLTKLRVQFVVFEKNYDCLFFPNCTRNIMCLLINNNIHEKIAR